MELLYNGTDITEQTRVLRCELSQYLSGRVDELTITFDNGDNTWTKWGPAFGDTIAVSEQYTRSGTLYVAAVTPKSGMMTLRAAAMKYVHSGHTKEWKNIRFRQLVETRGTELGLSTEFYGVTDQTYPLVHQNGSDLAFLSELCRLEGCVMMVSDGILRVVSYDYLSKMDTSSYTLDAFHARLYDRPYYTGAEVTDGSITGRSGDTSGEIVTLETEQALSSLAEANRFARNALSHANFSRKGGEAYADALWSEMMPGSKVLVNCDYWEGRPVIVTRVRHDLYRMKSKVWFSLMKGD